MRFEAHPWVSASIEEGGRLLRGGVDVVVVGKLRQREECVPVVLPFSNEDPQVLFQFLVDLFRLSEMKSTLMMSQRSSRIGSGWSSPLSRRRCILVWRHKSQWETYMPTYRDMFGHQ